MFNKLSYRNKLLLLVMPILMAGLLMLGFGAYWYINNVIEKELTSSMLATTGKSAESINTWLKTLLIEPETIASTPAAKAINKDFGLIDTQNISRHRILHQNYPDIFQDIYAANLNGEYHAVRQNGNDYSLFVGNISNRDYFKSIMAGGPAQITPPLVSRTTGIPTIFMVAPIHDDENRPQGLVGAGVSLDYVQKISDGLKIGQTGYGIVIARDGTVICHPNRELVFLKKIIEEDDPSVVALGKLMISGETGIFRYNYKGQKKMAFYQPIPITGWSVATVIPESELFAPVTRMLETLMLITLGVLALAGVGLLMAARYLTKPILVIRDAVSRFAGKDFSSRSTLQSDDELGELSKHFNHMASTIEDYSENMEQTIAERTLELTRKNEIIVLEKELAEAATQAKTQLLAEQEVLIKKLEDAQGQLLQSEKMASVGQLAAGVAHEINNPIGFINSNLNSLKGNVEDLLTVIAVYEKADTVLSGHLELLDAITKAKSAADLGFLQKDIQSLIAESLDGVHRVKKIVDNLKDFSRVDTAEWQYANLENGLESTLNIVWNELKYKAKIKKDYAGLPEIECIASQLNQVFMNLMVNAAHAIPEQGTITLRTGFDQSTVWVEVEDTGSGIKPEHLKRIFEPFFTTKPIGKGTGLGLSLAYSIVQRHHGKLDVHSELGEGTVFRVSLPRERVIEDVDSEIAA